MSAETGLYHCMTLARENDYNLHFTYRCFKIVTAVSIKLLYVTCDFVDNAALAGFVLLFLQHLRWIFDCWPRAMHCIRYSMLVIAYLVLIDIISFMSSAHLFLYYLNLFDICFHDF